MGQARTLSQSFSLPKRGESRQIPSNLPDLGAVTAFCLLIRESFDRHWQSYGRLPLPRLLLRQDRSAKPVCVLPGRMDSTMKQWSVFPPFKLAALRIIAETPFSVIVTGNFSGFMVL
jgi:hypothetical protein